MFFFHITLAVVDNVFLVSLFVTPKMLFEMIFNSTCNLGYQESFWNPFICIAPNAGVTGLYVHTSLFCVAVGDSNLGLYVCKTRSFTP